MSSRQEIWRVGVIGAGKHGSRYARHIMHDVAGLALTAVSRRSEEGRQLAGLLGCRWHADWRKLVADPEVDCVVSAVPPTLNVEIARACAEAGKPLLLEKPMATAAVDAAAITDLFAGSSLLLTVGQTLRYNQVIKTLRTQLDTIGPLYSFSANQRLEPTDLPWLDDPALAGAGVSFHTAVHVFDALRFITGHEIARVFARARCVLSARLEDLLQVLVELDNGVWGMVDCSKISPARSGRFEFVGQNGQLHGDQIHHSCERIQGMKQTSIALGEPVSTIVPLLTDWLSALRGLRPNPLPGAEGLAAVRICEACTRSALTGQWTQV